MTSVGRKWHFRVLNAQKRAQSAVMCWRGLMKSDGKVVELNNKVDNWGTYQIGMFLKYITQFEYEELIQTIYFIIKKFEKNIDVFFDKLQHIKIPEYFITNARSKKEYHIDENKFHYIDDLKSKNNIPEIDATFVPKKTTNVYCLVGFIYPFYFKFEYDVNKYPLEWFSKTFEN